VKDAGTDRSVCATSVQTDSENGLDAVSEAEREETTVTLDDDGNAFVVLLGGASCAAGTSLIEAGLEVAPYTTYTTTFTVEAPAPGLPE